MPAYRGPVDQHVELVTDLLVRYRGRNREALSSEEKTAFRNSIAALKRFAYSIGIFVTEDVDLIDAVFLDTLDGLRARIGATGRILSAIAWLSTVCRVANQGITASGKLFVEVRERVMTLTGAGVRNPPRVSATPMPPELLRLLFDDHLTRDGCKMGSLSWCMRGCDLMMLSQLKFPDEIIRRITGHPRMTCSDRLLRCKDALERAEKARRN